MVVTFGLARTLKYKKKRQTWQETRSELLLRHRYLAEARAIATELRAEMEAALQSAPPPLGHVLQSAWAAAPVEVLAARAAELVEPGLRAFWSAFTQIRSPSAVDAVLMERKDLRP